MYARLSKTTAIDIPVVIPTATWDNPNSRHIKLPMLSRITERREACCNAACSFAVKWMLGWLYGAIMNIPNTHRASTKIILP